MVWMLIFGIFSTNLENSVLSPRVDFRFLQNRLNRNPKCTYKREKGTVYLSFRRGLAHKSSDIARIGIGVHSEVIAEFQGVYQKSVSFSDATLVGMSRSSSPVIKQKRKEKELKITDFLLKGSKMSSDTNLIHVESVTSRRKRKDLSHRKPQTSSTLLVSPGAIRHSSLQ